MNEEQRQRFVKGPKGEWQQYQNWQWVLEPRDRMNVAIRFLGSEKRLRTFDESLIEEACEIAGLPGLMTPVVLMPNTHRRFGSLYGYVAAFRKGRESLIRPGAIEIDNAWGSRLLKTNLERDVVEEERERLAHVLETRIVEGLKNRGFENYGMDSIERLLRNGAHWITEQGIGYLEDLVRCEDLGRMQYADPGAISAQAKMAFKDRLSHIGNGNHHLEIQVIDQTFDLERLNALGLGETDVLVLIEAGSAGLSQKICREETVILGKDLWQPIESQHGKELLGSMHACLNAAVAYRQLLTHLVREAVESIWPNSEITNIVDMSSNSYKREQHVIGHDSVDLWVWRRGAVHANGPSHYTENGAYESMGRPLILGGAMGSHTTILCGVDQSEELALSSAPYGAGADELAEQVGLARPIARLKPLFCLQG